MAEWHKLNKAFNTGKPHLTFPDIIETPGAKREAKFFEGMIAESRRRQRVAFIDAAFPTLAEVATIGTVTLIGAAFEKPSLIVAGLGAVGGGKLLEVIRVTSRAGFVKDEDGLRQKIYDADESMLAGKPVNLRKLREEIKRDHIRVDRAELSWPD